MVTSTRSQDDDTKSFSVTGSVEFEATDDAFARTDDYGVIGRA